jgi:hypothetical protein
MIRALRVEAASAGDLVTVHAADVALGSEQPITTPDQWEERYGGGGHADYEREGVMLIADVDAARANLAECITDARAQDDSCPFVPVVA